MKQTIKLIALLQIAASLAYGQVMVGGNGALANVNLYDANGNPIILGQTNMTKSMPVVLPSDQTVAVTSDGMTFLVSVGNATTNQLGAGATFTGTIEDCSKHASYNLNVICDQNYTVVIEQFNDAAGTQKTTTDSYYTFTRSANVPLNEVISLVNDYVRVKVTNNGASPTTTLNVSGAFGCMTTLPYTLSNLGNLKVGLQEIGGAAVLTGAGTAAGALRVELPTDGTGKVNANLFVGGALNAVANPGFFRLTDGSNYMPTGDATNRSLFVKLSDGVNIHPAGDATNRSVFVKMSDGVNIHPAGDATNRSVYVRLSDGLNLMPSGDATNRSLFVRVSDGVNVLATADATNRASFAQLVGGDKLTVATVLPTLNALKVDLSSVVGTAAAGTNANGSTSKGLGEIQMTAVSNVDQSSTAFAGAGRVLGTAVASINGAGACISAEINVSALTLGTATAVHFILQESTGGTMFTDIWVSDPVTAAGTIRVPAIPISGRRRWCCHSVGGTSTTITATITTLELPAGYVCFRQGRDNYSATNPLQSVIQTTGATTTTNATTLVNTGGTCMTATTQYSAPWVVEGCKVVSMKIVLANGPTVNTQPVLTIQFSDDLTNWWNSAATITAAGNGTYSATAANVCFRYARIAVTTAAAYSSGNYTITFCGLQAVN